MWKRTICQNQQGRPKPTDERNGVFWQIVVVTIIVEWRQQEAGSGFFFLQKMLHGVKESIRAITNEAFLTQFRIWNLLFFTPTASCLPGPMRVHSYIHTPMPQNSLSSLKFYKVGDEVFFPMKKKKLRCLNFLQIFMVILTIFWRGNQHKMTF